MRKTPRAGSTYRAARRNAAKAARNLPQWREMVAETANTAAHINARAVLANSAREAAAKALVGNKAGRPDLVAAQAYLDFYRTEAKQTRAISRIIRDLEAHVRQVA